MADRAQERGLRKRNKEREEQTNNSNPAPINELAHLCACQCDGDKAGKGMTRSDRSQMR